MGGVIERQLIKGWDAKRRFIALYTRPVPWVPFCPALPSSILPDVPSCAAHAKVQ
jgi:hypothetical protein